MSRELRGALLAAHRRVAAIRMPDPDPDQYDVGYNAAVDAALGAIEAVGRELAERRIARPAQATRPHLSDSQRVVLDVIRRHGPIAPRSIDRTLGHLGSGHRTWCGAIVGRLLRGGLIRRVWSGSEMYELNR